MSWFPLPDWTLAPAIVVLVGRCFIGDGYAR
jgi:hypothetical protein